MTSNSKPVGIVTGASSGIGYQFAELLASPKYGSYDLVLVARNKDRLEELANKLNKEFSANCEVLPADLSQEKEVDKVLKRISDPERPIELLINNAGYGINGPIVDIDEEELIGEVLVNVVALFKLFVRGAKVMAKRGRGYILNVGSLAGVTPAPLSATYNGTKAFVNIFTESAASELSDVGVKVTCLAPGFTRTEFQHRAGIDNGQIPNFVWQDAQSVAKAGLDGLFAGKALVVPGIHNRVAYYAMRATPGSIVRPIAKMVVKRF